MNQKIISCLVVSAGALLLSASNGFAFGSYGSSVNSACSPVTPYTGDCLLCHTSSSKSAGTPAKTAFLAGGTTLTNFFCPPAPTPTCTDNDGDTFAVEGGDCGPVDCDDANAAVHPGATENCSDNVDNNCNGLVDDLDPAAVGCLVCTDSDGDGFAAEGGACGPVDCNDNSAAVHPGATDIPNNGIDEDCSGADTVDPTMLDNDGDGFTPATGDCNDTDAAINPGVVDIPNNGIDENCDGVDNVDPTVLDNDGDGFTPATGDCDDTDGTINPNAIENCSDQIDNDCNGLVDIQDPNAVDCPINCTDNDGDAYATNDGACGPVDCNDSDPFINPGATEICGDGIDNDCDGSVDEGCDVSCADLDGDGFQDASCGGTDCNDNDATINPGAAEVCGNDVDENCNGASDDTCLTCPDGSLLVIKRVRYNSDHNRLIIRGRATVGTTISIINTDTGRTLIEGVKVNSENARWRAVIKHVRRPIRTITAVSSNGCELDKIITRSVYGESDDHSDDSYDERSDDDSRERDDD